MWQQQKKDSAIANLALSLALATTPMAGIVFVSAPVLAQSATDTPTFSLPQTVENGSTVRVDGSSSLALINQNLKAAFEKQFPGTKVEVANNGTDAALQALLDGKIDVAAIARGLTPEEKAQGLEQVRLHREKIAIIVGEENPFRGSLTDKQFARIFRGNSITDWSQLGREAGKIQVIDRPNTSDTRQTLKSYPVFRSYEFSTGDTATQITEDNTAEIAKQLGKNGISYARYNQIAKLPGVRVLQLHQATPNDPKYPFSQPLVYVVRKNPTPAVAGFVGFALAQPGQAAIETARTAEGEAIAKGESPNLLLAVDPISTAEASTAPLTEATPEATASPFITATPILSTPTATSTEQQPAAASANNSPIPGGQMLLWWLVLPLAAIAALLLWMIKSSPSNSIVAAEEKPSAIPPASAPEVVVTTNNVHEPEPIPVNHSNGTNGHVPHNSANHLTGTTPATTDTTLAVGVGTVIGSMVIGKQTENHKAEDDYDLDISPWDMEAPAAVVNTAYPPILDRSKTTSQPEQSEVQTETVNTAPTVITPEIPTVDTAQTPTTEDANVAVELPEIPENSPDGDDWGFELTENLPETEPPLDPEVEKLNVVADAAEPDLEEMEELTVNNSEGLGGAGIGAWSNIDQLESAAQTPTSAITASLTAADSQSQITLTPSSHDLADVVWEISTTGEQMLQNAGVSQLAMRLYDVTNIDMSYQQPQLIQQSEYELTTSSAAVKIPHSDRDYVAALGYTTEGDRWVTIARSPIAHVFASLHPNAANVVVVDETSQVFLTARTHQLADVSWEMSETSKQILQNAGIFQLALRLYDATNIDMSYQQPELVQQYEVDLATTETSVGIPIPDHDYIAEIGYSIVGDRWVSIARSPIERVFSPMYLEDANILTGEQASHHLLEDDSTITLTPRTPKWAYAAWKLSDTRKQMLQNGGIFQLALRLYDATDIDMSYQQPQLIQQYECEEITHDRYVAIPTSDRDYMLELGYITEGDNWTKIARSSAVRIFSRPQEDFWFVADAELIIHGATEPNATVKIGGNPINLKPDGTFHLRIPFSENLIDYLMTAVTADGEKSKTIHKKFSQEVKEA